MPLLEVHDLHVTYGHVLAVRGASVHVDTGQIAAVVGPNGAGKSSTLRAIHGLVPAAAGTVTFAGEDVTGRAPEHSAAAGIALVPEGRGIFATLTVRENLMLGTVALGERPAVSIESALRYFPALLPRLDDSAGVLSGGERQQLAIGRALVSSPRLLILDEPSLGLAPMVVDEVFAAIRSLRDDGATILLGEQNVARAVALADRLYVLNNGIVEELEEPEQLLRDPALREQYLGFV